MRTHFGHTRRGKERCALEDAPGRRTVRLERANKVPLTSRIIPFATGRQMENTARKNTAPRDPPRNSPKVQWPPIATCRRVIAECRANRRRRRPISMLTTRVTMHLREWHARSVRRIIHFNSGRSPMSNAPMNIDGSVTARFSLVIRDTV